MNKAQYDTDKINYEFNFAPLMASGDSVTDATFTVDDGLIFEDTGINLAGRPTAFISGGVDGESYEVACVVNLASGECLCLSFILEIRVCR